MLNATLKRHIKLLAERFGHYITYDKEKIILLSDKNKVVIESFSKEIITVVYNSSESTKETIQVESSVIYDWLIRLFERDKPNKIEIRSGELLELKDYINEEYIAKKTISVLKNKWISSELEYMNLGGNRFEAEFYKGVIILKDDTNWKLANIIDTSVNDL